MSEGWSVLAVLALITLYAIAKWVVSDRIADMAKAKGLDGEAWGIIVLIAPFTIPFVWLSLRARKPAAKN